MKQMTLSEASNVYSKSSIARDAYVDFIAEVLADQTSQTARAFSYPDGNIPKLDDLCQGLYKLCSNGPGKVTQDLLWSMQALIANNIEAQCDLRNNVLKTAFDRNPVLVKDRAVLADEVKLNPFVSSMLIGIINLKSNDAYLSKIVMDLDGVRVSLTPDPMNPHTYNGYLVYMLGSKCKTLPIQAVNSGPITDLLWTIYRLKVSSDIGMAVPTTTEIVANIGLVE